MGVAPKPNAAPVLVWLPNGTAPAAHSFDAAADPTTGPVAYQLLSEALHVAETNTGHPGCDPWIKVGEGVYNRRQIHELYEAAHGFTDDIRAERHEGTL